LCETETTFLKRFFYLEVGVYCRRHKANTLSLYSRDSTAGSVTRLRARRPRQCGSIPYTEYTYFFSKATRPALGPIQLPIQWVAEGSRPKRKTDHSPPSTTKVKMNGTILYGVHTGDFPLQQQQSISHSRLVLSLQVLVSASFSRSIHASSAHMYSYTNLGMRVSFILNTCCVELHLYSTIISFKLHTYISILSYIFTVLWLHNFRSGNWPQNCISAINFVITKFIIIIMLNI
jgi:hypothetical protein